MSILDILQSAGLVLIIILQLRAGHIRGAIEDTIRRQDARIQKRLQRLPQTDSGQETNPWMTPAMVNYIKAHPEVLDRGPGGIDSAGN